MLDVSGQSGFSARFKYSFNVFTFSIKSCRLFALVMAVLAVIFACSTFLRNRVWQNNASLWLDIVNKSDRDKIIDQETGAEVPRIKRARAYCNIGLVLYKQACLMQEKIARFNTLNEQYRKSLSSGLLSENERGQSLMDIIDRLQFDIRQSAFFIVSHIPNDLREICHRRGVQLKAKGWDPFVPAEECFMASLRLYPRFSVSVYNLGMCYKMRAKYLRQDSLLRKEYYLQAIESFRVACAIVYGYEPGYRQLADCFFRLGEYAESLRYARLAIRFFNEGDTEKDVLLFNRQMVVASLVKLGRINEARERLRDLELQGTSKEVLDYLEKLIAVTKKSGS